MQHSGQFQMIISWSIKIDFSLRLDMVVADQAKHKKKNETNETHQLIIFNVVAWSNE